MSNRTKRKLIQWFPWFWFGKAFFKAFFNTKALGVALLNAKGVVLQCNDLFSLYLGRPRGLYQYPLVELWPQLEQSVQLALSNFHKVDSNGLEFDTYFEDSGITLKAMVFPLQNLWRKGHYLVVYLRDITKQVDDAKELRLSEAKFKSVFHSVSDLIMIVDKHNGAIRDVNEGWSRILNCSPRQLIGRKIDEIYFFDDKQSLVSAIENAKEHKFVENLEIPIVCATGERFVGLLGISEINYGNCSEFILNLHDVTESKLIEQLLSHIAKLVWAPQKENVVSQLLMYLADLIGSDHMVVSKIDPDRMEAQTLALIKFGKISGDIRYNLEGTPCRDVYNGEICIVNHDLQQRFPNDKGLVAMQAQSYIGVPVLDSKHAHIGIVAAIHTKPFGNATLVSKLLQIAAKTIGNEIERLHEEVLRQKQEEKYRQLFDHLTSGLALHEVRCDERGEPIDYVFLDVNPAFESYVGLNRDQLIGRTVLEIWPDTEPYWIQLYGDVALSGRSRFFEQYSQTFGKYYRGIAYSPAPNQFAVIFHDVTDLRANEQALREREQQLNTIFENTPSALLLVNENAEIVQMNPAGYQLANNSDLVQVRGRQVGNVLKCINSYVAEGGCGNAPACNECRLRQMLFHTFFKLSQHERTEIMFRQATETEPNEHYFMVSSALVVLKGQKHVLITMEDITAQKLMEIDLLESRNKAMESDRLKTAFFNNLSHEIRTPLNGIVGFSNLLRKEGIGKEEIGVFVSLINENSTRLLQIMNNVIELSQLSSGNFVPVLRTLDLHLLMSKCMSYSSEVYGRRHVEVKWGIEGARKIMSDYNAVQGIVSQLLMNALKFTATGNVWIRWYVGKKQASCLVADTGIGIDESQQEDIFKPFRQEEEGMTRSFGGVGIGLAIVKGYLDCLGGNITVKSQKGSGALFRFTIPINSFSEN